LSNRARIAETTAVLLVLSSLLPVPHAVAFSRTQSPAISIGESPSPLYGVMDPWGGLAFDPGGNLWVPDTTSNRILEFRAPFSDSMGASVVIGQRDFNGTAAGVGSCRLNSPRYVAFDRAGDIWVSDSRNSRVLEFEPPFQSGVCASVVIGQRNASVALPSLSRNGLDVPAQVTFDEQGDLWVADAGNGRVLEYQPPFTTGMNASLVIGEPDFTHQYCQPQYLGYSSSCSNHSILTGPEGIAFDPQGNLWVDEYGRLLEFKHLFKSGMDKSLLIQPVYSEDLAFDSNGDLWLTCGYCYGGAGGSVVGYRPPFNGSRMVWKNGNASNPDLVVSGPDTNQSPYPLSGAKAFSSVLVLPQGLTFDSAGNLWVVDTRSSWLIGLVGRVAGYDAQVHPVATSLGRVYFENQRGLLAPLSFIPNDHIGSLAFPDGLFNFTIQGLNSTEPVTLTITFPNALPPTVGWSFSQDGSWMNLPASQVSINGANLTLTLTGVSSNGIISMLGGPALGTGTTQISNTTHPANTSASTTSALTNVGEFPVESIAVGIIAGLAVLTIIRYRRHRRL